MNDDGLPVVFAREIGLRAVEPMVAVLPESSSAEMMCIFVEDPR